MVERQPVAFTRHGQQIGLVDANGVLLDMPAATMAAASLFVSGGHRHRSRRPAESRKARMAVYQRLMAELDANGQHFSEQISEIDLTDPEDARVLMPEQGADILAHFGEDHFLERYQRYKAHIAEWRQQYPKLAAVDLRYDQQVVLEMAPARRTQRSRRHSAADAKPVAAQSRDAASQRRQRKPLRRKRPACRQSTRRQSRAGEDCAKAATSREDKARCASQPRPRQQRPRQGRQGQEARAQSQTAPR